MFTRNHCQIITQSKFVKKINCITCNITVTYADVERVTYQVFFDKVDAFSIF